MRVVDIAIGLSAALAALTYLGTTPDPFGREDGRIKSAVAAALRDPSSAEFRNLRTGSRASCGEVNGKNSLGAYAGFKPFVYVGGVVQFQPESPVGGTIKEQTAYYQAQAAFSEAQAECYR